MKTIEQNGKVKRVDDLEAFRLVDKLGIAKYLPRSEWKKLNAKVQPVKKLEVEKPIEAPIEATKTKKKTKVVDSTKKLNKSEKAEAKKDKK